MRKFWVWRSVLTGAHDYQIYHVSDTLPKFKRIEAPHELFEVIEKSAYDLLKSDHHTLEEANCDLNAKLGIAVEVLEQVKKHWDISDPSSVRPAIEISNHCDIEIRNDSMAAGSIMKCIYALEKIKGEKCLCGEINARNCPVHQ